MLGKPRIVSLFPTRLINSIKHEHSCKILYYLAILVEGHQVNKIVFGSDFCFFVWFDALIRPSQQVWSCREGQFTYNHTLPG